MLAGLLCAYLVGSIPTAYVVVQWLKRIDVRTVGSGNVGATNAVRAAGFRAGLMVFLIDVAKGLIAVLLIAPWLAPPAPAAPFACGVAAVVGHMFPVFLGFRGGKGVATTIGALLGAAPPVAALCLLGWVASFAAWRYVSVGSLVAAALIPIGALLTRRPTSVVGLGAALGALVILRHQANIRRLLSGTEHRWGTPKEKGR